MIAVCPNIVLESLGILSAHYNSSFHTLHLRYYVFWEHLQCHYSTMNKHLRKQERGETFIVPMVLVHDSKSKVSHFGIQGAQKMPSLSFFFFPCWIKPLMNHPIRYKWWCDLHILIGVKSVIDINYTGPLPLCFQVLQGSDYTAFNWRF